MSENPVAGVFTKYKAVNWPAGGWAADGGVMVGCTTRGGFGSHPHGSGVTAFAQISRFDVDTGAHSVLWSVASDLNNDVNATSGSIFIRDLARIGGYIYAVVHDGRRISLSTFAGEYDVYIVKIDVATGVEAGRSYDGTALELFAADAGTAVAWHIEWATETVAGEIKNFLAVTRRPSNSGSGTAASVFYLGEDLTTYTPADGLGSTYTSNPSDADRWLSAYHKADGVAGVRYWYMPDTGANWRAVQGTAGFAEPSDNAGSAVIALVRGAGQPDYVVQYAFNSDGVLWDPDTGGEVWTDETETVQVSVGPVSPAGGPDRIGFLVTGEKQVAFFYVYDNSTTVRRYNDATLAWTSAIVPANGVAVLGTVEVSRSNPPNG